MERKGKDSKRKWRKMKEIGGTLRKLERGGKRMELEGGGGKLSEVNNMSILFCKTFTFYKMPLKTLWSFTYFGVGEGKGDMLEEILGKKGGGNGKREEDGKGDWEDEGEGKVEL